MPTVRLTDAAVQRLKAPSGGRLDYFDAAYPGLALRVTGAVDQRPERRTWTLFYRFGGKQRRLTFEPGYPALGLAEARDAANKAKLAIQAGVDPGTAKAEAKAEAARTPDTITNVAEMFIRRGLEERSGRRGTSPIHGAILTTTCCRVGATATSGRSPAAT